MGAKTWMLVYARANVAEILKSGPVIDRKATQRFVSELFPKERLEPAGDGDLLFTNPPDQEIFAGCFPGVAIVAAKEFGIDYPSKLPARFIAAGGDGCVYLHSMHSAVDWFAFAQWRQGELVRSLSLSPDSGILEDIGEHLPFEEPYWSGQCPATDGDDDDDEYPFPFHPLELGEAALKEFFGYQLEGVIDDSLLEPETVPLMKFRRLRPWWKLW